LIPDRFRNLKTKPMTLIGVQNGDSVGELEAEEEKLRINLECPQSIEGKTIRRGRVRENEASAIARHLLDMHLLDQKKSRGGDRALYYDPWKQLYWELTYLESDTFGEGPPSLIPLPHEQVKRLYDLEPIPRREKVKFAGYTTDWLEPGRRYKDPSLQIIAHIAGWHLVKAEAELNGNQLFWDPAYGIYYAIGNYLARYTDEDLQAFGIIPPAPEGMPGPLHLAELSYIEVITGLGFAPILQV
jgi:hypothetical protein